MKILSIFAFLITFNTFAAQSYEINHGISGEEKTVTFERQGPNVESLVKSFEAKEIKVDLYEKIETISSAYVLKEIKVGERCADTNKVYSSGSGNKKLRDMFQDDISSKTRMKLIRENIKGAGNKVASQLKWNFERSATPTSWKQFVAVIKKAQNYADRKGDSNDFLTEITLTFMKDNKRNLGLNKVVRDVVCTRWEPIYETKLVKVTVSDTRNIRVGAISKTVNLKVSNVELLAGEKEQFNVTYDGDIFSVTTSTTYGSYKTTKDIVGRDAYIELIGVRKKINAKNNLTMSLSKADNGQVILTVIDGDYNLRVFPETKLAVILYKDNFGPNQNMNDSEYFLNVDSNTTVINTGFYLPEPTKKLFSRKLKYHDFYVKVKLQRLESKFFNSRLTHGKESNKISN